MAQSMFTQLSGMDLMEMVANGATAASLGKTEVLVTITTAATEGMSRGMTPKPMLSIFLSSYDGVPIGAVAWETSLFASALVSLLFFSFSFGRA